MAVRNCVRSSSKRLRLKPSRALALSKRWRIIWAQTPVPVMRVPNLGSLSLPPRISRTRAITRSARSGTCCFSHCWNSGLTSHGRRSTMLEAAVAPASRDAWRMRSISCRLRNGIIGETLTPTGTPALANVSTVFKRR